MASVEFSNEVNRIRMSDIVSRIKEEADEQLYQYEEFLTGLEKKIQIARFKIREDIGNVVDLFQQKFNFPANPAIVHQTGLCLERLQAQLSVEPWFEITPHIHLLGESYLFADIKVHENRFEDISRSLQNLEALLRKPELNSEWDPSLVSVGHIVDLNEFYIHRMCDQTIRNWLHEVLNCITFPRCKEVKVGKMYAVQIISKNTWYRGLCHSISGYSHVAGKESEALFHFFLLDIGIKCDMIPSSCVSILPDEIIEIEPMAMKCGIDKFPEDYQRPELIQHFRLLTNLSPLCIKVFSSDGKFNSVDLSQIPVYPNEEVVTSIRGSLLQALQMKPSSTIIPRKHTTIKRGTCLLAIVANYTPPDQIYIEIDDTDENRERFSLLMMELQVDCNNFDQSKMVPSPKIGQAYAVHFLNRWIRVLLEQMLPGGRVVVYAIDSGRRLVIQTVSLRQLHERYLQLPARITCCHLTLIVKDDRQYTPAEGAELLKQGIVESRVTIFVEGQQLGRNYTTKSITAFQQDLNLFLTLELDDEEIHIEEFSARHKPLPSSRMLEEPEPLKRERRSSISEFFLNAPPET